MIPRPRHRFLHALAVTLPLGLEPAGDGGLPPRTVVPAEILADGEAIGAVGVVYREARGGEVCAAVALRERSGAPQLGPLQWRAGGGPVPSTTIRVEPLSPAEVPRGISLAYGCTSSRSPRAGGALTALLIEPGSRQARRRWVAVRPGAAGVWTWRALVPIEAAVAVVPEPPRRISASRRATALEPDALVH
jgi:hypothetical protein